MNLFSAISVVPTATRRASPPQTNLEKIPFWLREIVEREAMASSMEYLAKHSHSFRYAARFLPPPLNHKVADIYAFCRFTDDLVDKSNTENKIEISRRLDEWKLLAYEAYQGREVGLPLVDKPLLEMGKRGIPFRYADELIEGVRMDLTPRYYATQKHLEQYTFRVASVVGLWLSELVGVKQTSVLLQAEALGHAMQLTNILRDVGEDAASGRVYLPMDKLFEYGIPVESLAAIHYGYLEAPQPWRALMEDLFSTADQYYQQAFSGITALPHFFQRPVLISALVYQDIHQAIRKNDYNNFTRRAHTQKARKVWLGIKAWFLLHALRRKAKQKAPVP